MILIGTSGYSFEDWRGVYYPHHIDRGKMLDYYARDFKTVEINSTYYRIPPTSVFYHMDRKTPPDFEFMAKLHQDVTHARQNIEDSIRRLQEALKPLYEAGKLKGLLAQFPWGFKNTPENRDYLLKIKELCGDTPLFVEFRNRSWVKEDVYELLRSNGIGYCCVDEPRFSSLIPPQDVATTSVGYVRFHGRNAQTWWKSSGGDRYDYLYSTDELKEWVDRIESLKRQTEKTYLFFNNCHRGQAVINARQMEEILRKRGLLGL